jgi:hypothetical protein
MSVERGSTVFFPGTATMRETIEAMRSQRLTFVFFAAAILFSMVREWNAPATCTRSILVSSIADQPKR